MEKKKNIIMVKKILICLFYFLFFISNNVFGQSLPIKYFQTDPRYEYRVKLLQLALVKISKTYGTFSLRAYQFPVTQSRGLLLLKRNEVDIAFLATNKKRELDFLPTKIPILRGILGYRVFLIHKHNKDDFAKIKTFEQLKKKYIAGFGSQWADYNILKANKIEVMGVAMYENLFKMLMKKRFDYFPRGINEAWNEINIKGKAYPNLAVEENLALYYPFPIYFFVNKEKAKLANKIEHGLKIALEDGSFKKLFFEYHDNVIKQANLNNRILFKLTNPTLPKGSPEIDTRWWLQKK